MAALLGLFWRLLREGRLKVARGRSWQPEIGMEHASRGRRSGNKGVGARWRGRFRIFSARHCSRTKVSHAENSGMTMTNPPRAISPEVARRRMTTPVVAPRSGLNPPPNLRCRRGILSHPQERPATHAAAGAAARGVRGGLGDYFAVGLGAVAGAWVDHRSGQTRMPPQERRHEEVFGLGDSFTRSGPASHACRRRSGCTRN